MRGSEVIDRSMSRAEKAQLVQGVLEVSGIYMKESKRPIEMTIVQKSEVNPWCYPPKFEFQYGEWLRDSFEGGTIEPWSSYEMPDLAILITQLLLASKTLVGAHPDQILCKVPYKDFMTALTDELPNFMSELDSDTRNVLLTLARIWSTVETDTIHSKPAAADWVIERLPEAYRPVLRRAKAICIGKEDEHWDDLRDLLKPCADLMFEEVNSRITEIMQADSTNKSIASSL